MGITVAMTTEHGLVEKQVEDPSQILNRLLPTEDDKSFHLLRYIDPYGDTVFNILQLDDFLSEWARLRERAMSPIETELLSAIEALARECRQHAHQYLKFVGD
jgi:hypothetical protein